MWSAGQADRPQALILCLIISNCCCEYHHVLLDLMQLESSSVITDINAVYRTRTYVWESINTHKQDGAKKWPSPCHKEQNKIKRTVLLACGALWACGPNKQVKYKIVNTSYFAVLKKFWHCILLYCMLYIVHRTSRIWRIRHWHTVPDFGEFVGAVEWGTCLRTTLQE